MRRDKKEKNEPEKMGEYLLMQFLPKTWTCFFSHSLKFNLVICDVLDSKDVFRVWMLLL